MAQDCSLVTDAQVDAIGEKVEQATGYVSDGTTKSCASTVYVTPRATHSSTATPCTFLSVHC